MNHLSAPVLLAHEVNGLLPRVSLNGGGKSGHVGQLLRVLGVNGVVPPREHPRNEQVTRGVVPKSHNCEGRHGADSSAVEVAPVTRTCAVVPQQAAAATRALLADLAQIGAAA